MLEKNKKKKTCDGRFSAEQMAAVASVKWNVKKFDLLQNQEK